MTAVADQGRLDAVRATALLDTGADEAFDRLARLAATLLQVPFAFVTVVDNTRSFWKSCIGTGLTVVADRQNKVEESFCQYVIETDEPLIVGDARLNALTQSNPSIEQMNVLAWAGFPLRSADGFVLGTFCVVDTVTRDWTERDVETLESLAAAVEGEMRLRTTVEQLATSERALRYEMDVRERLAELARELVAANTTDDVAAAITEHGGTVLGAEYASVALLDIDRRELRMRVPRSLDPEIAARYATIALSDVTPLGDAVTRLEPVLLRDHADHDPRYSHLVTDASASGLISTAAFPLLRSDGSAVGAIGVGWARPNVFTMSEMALLETVASMCAQAIERAQLGDVRDGLMRSLQQQLLPAVPVLAGLETAVRYIPATFGLGFGGDWYDVIALPDGRVSVVIGDIAGHGIEAAARMAQVRGAINALTRLHADDLASVFGSAEAILRHIDEVYIATLAVFVVDIERETIEYVSAGHPPAVLGRPDGTVELLDRGRRPILGIGGPPPEIGRARFAVGSVLVAYTDGLIERRREMIDVGIDRLIGTVGRAVAAASDDLEQLLDQVLTDQLDRSRIHDDVAVIVTRLTG